METVPYQVKNIDGEAEEKNQQKKTGEYFFSNSILFGSKICGNKQKRQNTAINKGKSLGAHRIIGSGQELEEEIHQVEFPFKLPTRVGEGRFTKVEGVICTENDKRRNTESQKRIAYDTAERAEKVQFLAHRIVTEFCGITKVVNEEVDCTVNANHIANVVVAKDCNGQGYNVELEFAVLDDAFNAQGNQGQPHNGIDPHCVVLLNDGIRAKRIAGRENNDGSLVRLF